MCEECYCDNARETPLLHPRECLEKHLQYICGSCGRCICIQADEKRGLQRWSFPFKSVEIAMLYLRSAEYTTKKRCAIYEIKNAKGRVSYKIFSDSEELSSYLKKHPDKISSKENPVFEGREFKEYPNTQVRRLTREEMEVYLKEQKQR